MSKSAYLNIASLLAFSGLALPTFAAQAEPGERERDAVGSITPHRSEDRFVPADPSRDEGPARFVEDSFDAAQPLPVPVRSMGEPQPVPQPSEAITLGGMAREAIPFFPGEQARLGRSGDPFVGALTSDDIQVYDFGDFVDVSCPSCSPHSRNVHLSIQWPDGNGGSASGALIDSRHVITAAHCVFSANNGGWANSVVVRPGRDGSSAPFGTARMIDAMAWTAYTQDGNLQHDIAVIQLDRPVGALTGWQGYGYTSSCSHFTNPSWYLKSYPGGPFSGTDMQAEYGDFDACSGILEARRDKPMIGGMSGSGAYKYMGSSGAVVYAVTSHTNDGVNFDSVRLTSGKFAHVEDFIDSITPSSRDLVPIDVGAGTIAPRGGYISGMNYLVHNYSSASSSGNATVKVYLSTNSNISQWDTQVQSHSIHVNLSSKGSTRVNVGSVYVPTNISPGWYYLGVIVQGSDANTSNNDTDGQDAHRIYIY